MFFALKCLGVNIDFLFLIVCSVQFNEKKSWLIVIARVGKFDYTTFLIKVQFI